jgi:predicted ATPase/class 3 adenylate cyclase
VSVTTVTANNTSFYVSGGTLRPDAPSYVERQADRDLSEGLRRGEFCYVLTSRQMGKSSLMVRTAQGLKRSGAAVVVLDLTAVGQNLTPEQWYGGMLNRLGNQLGLEDELEAFWWEHEWLSPVQRFFTAIRNVVLTAIQAEPDSEPVPGTGSNPARKQLVIFVDEIDVTRSLPFSTDEFFGAIRECCNRRTAESAFNGLTFCLLGVATPSELMRDARRTPFNIGRRIELSDFTSEEARPLARGLDAFDLPHAERLLERILYWTAGHPYLTQRLCQSVADAVAAGPETFTDQGAGESFPVVISSQAKIDHFCEQRFLSARARETDDNLIFVRERILRDKGDIVGRLRLYGEIIAGKPVLDQAEDPLVAGLRLSGLIQVAQGLLYSRNRIYGQVYNLNWVVEKLEMQRLKADDSAVAEALMVLRPLVAQPPPERHTGQLKQVTVVALRFAGYPEWTRQSRDEKGRRERLGLRERLTKVINEQGGLFIDQSLDLGFAVFGASATREDEAEMALRSALAMQAEARDFQEQLVAAPELDLDLRIAVHTGAMALGEGGKITPRVDQHETWQQARNLLDRALPGTVLISHSTYRQLPDIFEISPGTAASGGDGTASAPVYLVRRLKPRSAHFGRRSIEGIETRMVGRESELRRLDELLGNVLEEPEPQTITVVGEAGIGKSRLLSEFYQQIEPQRSRLSILRGRASEGMADMAYAVFRDAFSFRFDIQDSDRPAVARQKLEQGFIDLLAAGRRLSAAEVLDATRQAHFIGQLLGLDFSASPHLRGIQKDGRQIRDRAFQYLAQFFQRTSQMTEGPIRATVLSLEDLHWADEGSLDLIDYLGRACPGTPMLILCLARPSLFERRPSWGEGEAAHARLIMTPLSKRDCRQLVEEILAKVPQVPAAVREWVAAGSEGNPFYLEELVKMLIDLRVIVPEAGQWSIDLSRLPVLQVPPSLAGLLQARLDHLSAADRVLLQRASVMGRVFWDRALETFGKTDRPPKSPSLATEESLERLRRKELIFRRESSSFAGAREYVFRHALLRAVVYQTILPEDRKGYHAQAATWLMDESGERVSEFAAVVAGHFEGAGNALATAEWYGRAGHQARAAWSPQLAIGYYQKALVDQRPSDHRGAWYAGLGECLAAQAQFAEAERVYRQMLALAQPGDAEAAARAWNGLAFVYERQGANRASIEAATQSIDLVRDAGENAPAQTLLARALFLKGWAYYRLGDAAEVLAWGEQALALSSKLEIGNEKVNSLKLIACGHLLLGRHQQASRFFEEALELAQTLNDRRNVGAMWSNLGETARMRGDYRAAIGYYEKAIGVAREIGSVESELLYLSNLGGARTGLGTVNDHTLAEANLQEVIDRNIPHAFLFAETYRFLAEARLGQGKVESALAAAEKALAFAERTENQDHLAAAWRVLGEIAAKFERPNSLQNQSTAMRHDPVECFTRALKIFETMGSSAERARTLRVWAECEQARGHAVVRDKLWREARDIFQQLDMPLEVERMDGPGRGAN